MRRLLLAFVVLLGGCVPEPTMPVADDFTPWIAVAIGISTAASVKPDGPSDTCPECGGSGVLGDGTIQIDCPKCEPEPLENLSEEIDTNEKEAPLPDVIQDIRLSELDVIEEEEDAWAVVPETSGSGFIRWLEGTDTSFRAEREYAREVDKNLVIVFSMPEGCKACRTQEEVVFTSSEVIEYVNNNCVMCRVDFSEQPKLVSAWCIDANNPNPGAPAVVVVSKNGKWRMVGCGKVSVKSFLEFVKSSISKMEKL